MKATTAYLITDMLKSVVEGGTGTGAQIGEAAGKPARLMKADLWFVGYTPELITAVWIGYDQPTPMLQAYEAHTLRVWQEIMSKALRMFPLEFSGHPAG